MFIPAGYGREDAPDNLPVLRRSFLLLMLLGSDYNASNLPVNNKLP